MKTIRISIGKSVLAAVVLTAVSATTASANITTQSTLFGKRAPYTKVNNLLGPENVVALGQSATITASANRNTTINIEIGGELEDGPNGRKQWTTSIDGSSNMVDRRVSAFGVNRFEAKFINLQPRRRYIVLITATDPIRREFQQISGAFFTLSRRVELTLDSIQMIDDSDWSGSCECSTLFGFDGRWLSGGTASYSSDETHQVGQQFVISYQKAEPLSYMAQMKDDDCYGAADIIGLCEDLPTYGYTERGFGESGFSDKNADRAKVWGQIDMNPTPDGPEELSGTFVAKTESYDLKYAVNFSYRISYFSE
jgi:hypothetical protein